MAYQAAESLKAGRLKIVLAKFEQPPRPIHIVYPTSRLLSARCGLSSISSPRSATGISARLRAPSSAPPGTCRWRARSRFVGLDQALRKQIVLPGLDHVGLDREPLPDLRGADEVDRERDRHQRRHPAHLMGATMAYRGVGEGRDQPAVNQPAPVGMRLGQPQADDDGLVGLLRIQRLPGVGQRAPAQPRLKAKRNVGGNVGDDRR